MQRSVLDTGPIVALFDRNDRYYHDTYDFMKNYNGIFHWIKIFSFIESQMEAM